MGSRVGSRYNIIKIPHRKVTNQSKGGTLFLLFSDLDSGSFVLSLLSLGLLTSHLSSSFVQ